MQIALRLLGGVLDRMLAGVYHGAQAPPPAFSSNLVRLFGCYGTTMDMTPKKYERRSDKQRHQKDNRPRTNRIKRIRASSQRGHIGLVSVNRCFRIRVIDSNPNATNGVAIIPEELHKIFIEQESFYPL